jgi:hypothetical protein
MEQLPVYISIIFILTALLTVGLFYRATNFSKSLIITVLIWLILQSVIGLSGFYTVTDGQPPRFILLVLPPMLFIAGLFVTKAGRRFIDTFDGEKLTLLHIIRIPVELILYWLFLHKVVPKTMTFEGRNLDILCGCTAPFIYYYGYVRKVIGKKTIMAWNIICLLLLLNIVGIAVLSVPSPFQKFGFDQPNVALFHFPFIWLPSCMVPIVILSHLVAIRSLQKNVNN